MSSLERMMINVVIVLAGLLYVATNTLNLSLASIGAASGVLSIVLGIALQNIILDLFAGILLNVEKPFRLLNWVTVTSGGTPVHGQVRNMNWRTTQLQTRENDLVSIPNSVMARATINNHATPSSASRMKLEFVVTPKVAPARVRQIMRDAVRLSADAGLILDQPPPSVLIAGVHDRGIQYRVLFYLNLNIASDSLALNSVAENVLNALADARIELAFGYSNVFMGAGDSETGVDLVAMEQPPGITAPAAPAGLLSREDITLIRSSWATARAMGEAVAILFYDRLFEIAPSFRSLFRSDAKAQRAKFLGMVTMLVKALDHPDVVVETLADLGLRHRTFNVLPEHYETVGAALIWTFEKGLGDAFDPPARVAWLRLYGAMCKVMLDAAAA